MKTIYRPTLLTLAGLATTIAAIAGTTGYILGRAPSLPHLLAVHFDSQGIADRFVRTSYSVVLVPVWIQLTLAIVCSAQLPPFCCIARRGRDAPSKTRRAGRSASAC